MDLPVTMKKLFLGELTHQAVKGQQSNPKIFTSTLVAPITESSEAATIPQVSEGLIDKFNHLKNIEDEFSQISSTSPYVLELALRARLTQTAKDT